ncbi:MAG: sodium:proton antiporter [Kamptonema sp. SIO4C4]|nr:sodium:proton antiporter [Kamptonema sp. SIO4C4]
MSGDLLLTLQTTLLLLLLVACLSAIAFKRLQFPYSVGLAIIGLILGGLAEFIPLLNPLKQLTLSHDLILYLFLPPLVFESALNLNSRLLRRNFTPVFTLATLGLLLSAFTIGGGLWGVGKVLLSDSLPLLQTLLFGTLISATDPVAVIALFKELGVSQRLLILVEGESLLNDAAAIVLFETIRHTLPTDAVGIGVFTHGLWLFLQSFLGGGIVGVILGYVMNYFIKWAGDRPLIQGTVSAILAYSAFMVAEGGLGFSGVIAVLMAGIVSSVSVSRGLNPDTREFLHEFWQYTSFLANSLIFLLIGLTTIQFIPSLSQNTPLLELLGLTILLVTLTRVLVVLGILNLVNRFSPSQSISLREQMISMWGGLRGAVSLALVLGINPAMEDRNLLVFLTFGVTLFTLLIPGTTIKWVIRRLKLDRPSILERLELAEGKVSASRQALEEVAALAENPMFTPQAIQYPQRALEQQFKESQEALNQLKGELRASEGQMRQVLWLQAIAIENKHYRRLYDKGLLAELTLEQLNLTITIKRDEVLDGFIPPKVEQCRPWEFRVWRVLRLIPGFNFKQQQLYLLQSRYEYTLTVAAVGEVVAKEVEHLVENYGISSSIAESCSQSYTNYTEEALRNLEEIRTQHPEHSQQWQTAIAQRVSHIASLEAVDSLTQEGAISETVATQLHREIMDN